MIFRKRGGWVLLDTELRIDGVEIEMVENTKFLGIIIDKCFKFDAHIQFIKGKVSRGIGILNKCKKYFNSSTLLTLYYSFIYPYFNYCNCIWGNTCKTYLIPLINLQKMAMRIIEGAERRAHTENIFTKLNILNMNKLYVYCSQLFLFKYHFHKLPAIFDGFFYTEWCSSWYRYQMECFISFCKGNIFSETKSYKGNWSENIQLLL